MFVFVIWRSFARRSVAPAIIDFIQKAVFDMILKKWSPVFAQIFAEAKKIDWFSKEDLLGAVSKVLLIVAIVSTAFLGIDWIMSKLVAMLLRI